MTAKIQEDLSSAQWTSFLQQPGKVEAMLDLLMQTESSYRDEAVETATSACSLMLLQHLEQKEDILVSKMLTVLVKGAFESAEAEPAIDKLNQVIAFDKVLGAVTCSLLTRQHIADMVNVGAKLLVQNYPELLKPTLIDIIKNHPLGSAACDAMSRLEEYQPSAALSLAHELSDQQGINRGLRAICTHIIEQGNDSVIIRDAKLFSAERREVDKYLLPAVRAIFPKNAQDRTDQLKALEDLSKGDVKRSIPLLIIANLVGPTENRDQVAGCIAKLLTNSK